MSGHLARLAAMSKRLMETKDLVPKTESHPLLRVPPLNNRSTDVIVALDTGPSFGSATYHPYPSDPQMHFDLRTDLVGKDGHAFVEWLVCHLAGLRTTAILRAPEDVEVRTWLIIEKFEFRKDDQERDRIDYTAAEYVGVAKLAGWQAYDTVVMQGASEAKGFWSDAKLRRLGLYCNTRHGRDALRHLLQFMAFKRGQKWLLAGLK